MELEQSRTIIVGLSPMQTLTTLGSVEVWLCKLPEYSILLIEKILIRKALE
jgi:hypothetical protein